MKPLIIRITQGMDTNVFFKFKDNLGVPVDLSYYDLFLKVYVSSKVTKFIDELNVKNDRLSYDGEKVKAVFTAEATEEYVNDEYFLEILAVNKDTGKKTKIASGYIKVLP